MGVGTLLFICSILVILRFCRGMHEFYIPPEIIFFVINSRFYMIIKMQALLCFVGV
jgi:hypothetical protein